jgi:uncharacterized membrane protein
MRWNLRYAIISYLRSTLWIVPVIALAFEQATLKVAYVRELDFGFIPGFSLGGGAVSALMDYIVAMMISFIVFTFGSLLVAIQIASGQLSPRIIATTLLRDNVIRFTVGLFTYTLLLAIAVKIREQTISHTFASLAGVLAVGCVVAFLFLIDHAARLLRPVNIVWRGARQGIEAIGQVYPNLIADAEVAPPKREKLSRPDRVIFHDGTSAIVIAVNLKALVAAATKAGGVIELAPRVGDFVAVDEPLFLLRGGAVAIDDSVLRGQVAFGRERTIEQDSTFAFRVIVDIAIKALSKAINDPTTAVLAIDQLHRLLRMVGKRELHDENIRDGDGQLRVIFRTPNWEDFVKLAMSEIRLYGAENFQISRRLHALIENLIENLPERRLMALRRELDLLDRTLEKLHQFPEDLALARVPDSQGLGGSSLSVNGDPLTSPKIDNPARA